MKPFNAKHTPGPVSFFNKTFLPFVKDKSDVQINNPEEITPP